MGGWRGWLAGLGWVLSAWTNTAAAQAGASLPIEAFARLPMVRHVSLSPDGAWFAAIIQRGGDVMAVVRPIDGEQAPRALLRSDARESDLAWVRWVTNDRLLISVHLPVRRDGLRFHETRLVAVNRDGSKLLTLVEPSPFAAYDFDAQLQDDVIDWLPGDGRHVLLQAGSARSDPSPTVFRVDVETGRREVEHARRPGVRRWMTDRTHRVRVGVKQDGTRIEILACDPDGNRWRTLWSHDLFDRTAVRPLGFGADPNLLYVNADHQGRLAVFEVDLRDPALPRRLLLHSDRFDVSGRLMVDPASGRALGTGHAYLGRADTGFWDGPTQALLRGVDQALPDRWNRLQQFSADGSRYLIYSSGNGLPGVFLVGDKGRQKLEVIGRQYPELPVGALARKTSMTMEARDGRKLPVFLTLPVGSSASGLPAVVLPHGGPITSDDVDFEPLVQFLAHRGYAVLQVNFRGSTGIGFEHMAAGLRRWGLEMQDDVSDAARWLAERGTADKSRICIVGASYGGYAALMGGATTPELYRCVASFAGVTDLIELSDNAARFQHGRKVFDRQIGSAWDERQRLIDTSPRTLAEKFRVPVLLVHGTADASVPYRQSQRMADALKAAGSEVRLVRQEDGDHHLSHGEHRLQFFRELEAFLGRHLGAPATETVEASKPQAR